LSGVLRCYRRGEAITSTGGLGFEIVTAMYGIADAAAGGIDPRAARTNAFASTDCNSLTCGSW
jgi:hypothetical protein